MTIGARGISNAGTFELTSTGTANAANLTMSGGNFTNAAGGTFNILAGSGGTRTLTLINSQFLNQSAVNLNGTNLSVQTSGSSAFTNDVNGALALGAGTTLTDAAGLTNNGVLTGTGTVAANILGTGTISPGQTPGTVDGQRQREPGQLRRGTQRHHRRHAVRPARRQWHE